MTIRRSIRPAALLAILALVVLAATGPGAAPAAGLLPDLPLLGGSQPAGPVHPGIRTQTDNAQCTANFVFRDVVGTGVYLGQAAHCAAVGTGGTAPDGCEADSLPLGTPVTLQGATQPATLAYSSWLTMQAVGETDPLTCVFNDFALLLVHPADRHLVDPTMPVWGGPIGLAGATEAFQNVYSVGNSVLRGGLLNTKEGYSLGTSADGWNHTVLTLTPGVPGDSGSGYLDADGRAFGVLSTLAIAPLAGSNGVSDLALALDYVNTHSSLRVELVPGTQPFAPGLLP